MNWPNPDPAHAWADSLARENKKLRAELERVTRERDVLRGLHVHRSAAVTAAGKPLWDVLLPNRFSPLGFSWWQDVETEEEAVAILYAAIGLGDPPAGADDATDDTPDPRTKP